MSHINPELVSASPLAEGFSSPNGQTSAVREAMSPRERVRQHRTKLHEEQRRRLEVWISTPLIEKVSQIARANHEPLWSAVQKALEAHVELHRELAAESRRLIEESTYLREQLDSPERRRQVNEYNRKLGDFRERLAKFQQPHRPLDQAAPIDAPVMES